MVILGAHASAQPLELQGYRSKVVDSGSTVDGYLDLVGEFRRRFPLFDRIVGWFGEDTPAEPIPWFFGFLLGHRLGLVLSIDHP